MCDKQSRLLEYTTLPTATLSYTPFNQQISHLTVQFNVLGEGGVNLGEGAAQATAGDIDQVLQAVHVIILHKVLSVLKLWRNRHWLDEIKT